jgi:hypothetical protein
VINTMYLRVRPGRKRGAYDMMWNSGIREYEFPHLFSLPTCFVSGMLLCYSYTPLKTRAELEINTNYL